LARWEALGELRSVSAASDMIASAADEPFGISNPTSGRSDPLAGRPGFWSACLSEAGSVGLGTPGLGSDGGGPGRVSGVRSGSSDSFGGTRAGGPESSGVGLLEGSLGGCCGSWGGSLGVVGGRRAFLGAEGGGRYGDVAEGPDAWRRSSFAAFASRMIAGTTTIKRTVSRLRASSMVRLCLARVSQSGESSAWTGTWLAVGPLACSSGYSGTQTYSTTSVAASVATRLPTERGMVNAPRHCGQQPRQAALCWAWFASALRRLLQCGQLKWITG
jgi:hypothetical protein